MNSHHQPTRPTWRCTACGQDWPCRSRRDELLAEAGGEPVPLALLMASYFHDAVSDHPTVLVSALYVRFFGWVRRDPPVHDPAVRDPVEPPPGQGMRP